MRTTRKTVTFLKTFKFIGTEGPQPPGDYEIVTDEELIYSMSFAVWHRVGTSIRFPALGKPSAQQQWVTINPDDLDAALMADHPSTD